MQRHDDDKNDWSTLQLTPSCSTVSHSGEGGAGSDVTQLIVELVKRSATVAKMCP